MTKYILDYAKDKEIEFCVKEGIFPKICSIKFSGTFFKGTSKKCHEFSKLAAFFKYDNSSNEAGDTYKLLIDADIIFDAINNGKLKPSVSEEDKYLIMENLIYLFEETGVHYYRKPYLKQALVKKLYDYSGGKEYERYLNLCLDDKNEKWFRLEDQTAEKAPLDREEEVYKIVFKNYQEGLIRKEIFSDKKDILLEKIKSWLLANYDLYNLKRFEKGLKLYNKPCCAEKRKKIQSKSLEQNDIKRADNRFQLANACIFLLVPTALLIVLYYIATRCNCAACDVACNRVFWGILTILIIIFMNWLGLFDNYSSLFRLAGCILAGYFAINSDESWSGILLFEEGWLKIIYRWVILGFFTFFYLKREISNKVKKNKLSEKLKTSVFRKTLAFFIRTAGYSLIIGIFFSDFFGEVLITRNTTELEGLLNIPSIESIAHFPFIAGNIYPEIILSQAPLAMFIGIFINLLWEDKALTEPL